MYTLFGVALATVAADPLNDEAWGNIMRTITRGTAALGGLLMTAVILTGCAATNSTAAPTASTTPTATAAVDGDGLAFDDSESVTCGQASALMSIEFNAAAELKAEQLTQDEYESRLEAARYGLERMPANGSTAAAVTALGKYLGAQPGKSYDPSADGWSMLSQRLTDACSAAGSPLGITASIGG